jgi:hypothetical protein
LSSFATTKLFSWVWVPFPWLCSLRTMAIFPYQFPDQIIPPRSFSLWRYGNIGYYDDDKERNYKIKTNRNWLIFLCEFFSECNVKRNGIDELYIRTIHEIIVET